MNAQESTQVPRWLSAAAIAFGCVVTAVLVALYAWQIDVRDSRLQEADRHATAVILLQDAAADSDIAAELLAAYAAQGNENLVPQIQARSVSATEAITNAVSASGSAFVSAIAVEGAALADGAGRVIALRQNGNVETALATIEQMRPAFDSFGIALEEGIGAEIDAAAGLQTDADNAGTTSAWLLVTALATGVATGGGALVLAVRSLLRRRAPETTAAA